MVGTQAGDPVNCNDVHVFDFRLFPLLTSIVFVFLRPQVDCRCLLLLVLLMFGEQSKSSFGRAIGPVNFDDLQVFDVPLFPL